MNPDSLILQMLVEKQQEIVAARVEIAQLREHIEQRATEETGGAPTLDDEEVR